MVATDFKNNTPTGNYQIKQYHQNYGYNLEKTLSKYPITELQNEKFKESLIRSLERGNLQSATFIVNGKEEKIYISANPAFKSLNAYSSDMQKISLTELMQKNKQEQKKTPELSVKQSPTKENKISGKEDTGLKKIRRRQKISG